MKQFLSIIFFMLLIQCNGYAQNIGIGTFAPHLKALADWPERPLVAAVKIVSRILMLDKFLEWWIKKLYQEELLIY